MLLLEIYYLIITKDADSTYKQAIIQYGSYMHRVGLFLKIQNELNQATKFFFLFSTISFKENANKPYFLAVVQMYLIYLTFAEISFCVKKIYGLNNEISNACFIYVFVIILNCS